jgi:hypothetical protein
MCEYCEALPWHLPKAVETLTRERDEAITKWARAAEEAHDATARADRLQATVDGLVAKVKGAFPNHLDRELVLTLLDRGRDGE